MFCLITLCRISQMEQKNIGAGWRSRKFRIQIGFSSDNNNSLGSEFLIKKENHFPFVKRILGLPFHSLLNRYILEF